MSPKEMADYIVVSVAEMQHNDDAAKHIIPSTIEISIFISSLLKSYSGVAFEQYFNSVLYHIKKLKQ